MSTQTFVTEIPSCDFCLDNGTDEPATVDARTVFGPWANMCWSHFAEYTDGRLGTGHGQRLIQRAETS